METIQTLSDGQMVIEKIEKEIKSLEEAKLRANIAVRNIFIQKAMDFLNDGVRFVKFKHNNKDTYAIIEKIEPAVWNNGVKVSLSSLNLYGLFIFTDGKSYYHANNMCCFHLSKIYTFFDEIEDISKEELNNAINEWYVNIEDEYLNPNNEGLPEEEWLEPEPNWFFEDNYYRYFINYKNLLNNTFINKKFEKNGQ